MRRWMLLGHFAFSRIAIYEDTHPERWPDHPASHSLVGPLLSGYEAGDIDSMHEAMTSAARADLAEVERTNRAVAATWSWAALASASLAT